MPDRQSVEADYPRVNVLGVGVHAINLDDTLAQFRRWIEAGEKAYVCLAPVHNILACRDDPSLRVIFNHSGLTTPDGMPLVWIARAQGHKRTDRVYGPDIILASCRASVQPGYRHYFYGGHEGVAASLASRLQAQFPGLEVAGAQGPPFRELSAAETRAEIERINRAQPDIVWVALGSPRQERWMAENLDRLNASVLVGVGAAFDFLTGRVPHAPRWIQRSGFEWLFRLATEPRRLWRRYLRYPLFVLLYTLQALGLKRYSSEVEDPPDSGPTANILGVQVSGIEPVGLNRFIIDAVKGGRRARVLNVNAHALNLASELPWLKEYFNEVELVFPDGYGAVWAARRLGVPFSTRITYADWLWDLAAECERAGVSLYFLGARQGVAEAAGQALKENYPDLEIRGAHHGYFDMLPGAVENERVLAGIRATQPDVLLVGFGMPLQERWLRDNWDRLEVPVALTAGAAFDYVSGYLPRPPRILTDHGLEWLGRFLIEPRRLWRRYLLGNPRFVWRVLRQRLGRKERI